LPAAQSSGPTPKRKLHVIAFANELVVRSHEQKQVTRCFVASLGDAKPQRSEYAGSQRARRRERLHALTSALPAASGNASTNVAPCPSRSSAQTRPPFASANPRAIASPSPAPPAPT